MTRTIPRRTTLILAMALGMTPFMASAQSNHTSAIADRPQEEERLSFQTHGEWNPRVHVNADVAMVYDIDVTLPQRLKTWLDRGYIPQVMSGVTWGEYAEYYYGDFDGINHMFEVQKEEGGGLIGHGKDNYYICPSISYGKFLIKGVKRAIDAGAMAIHMEEPEFWVRAGYSEGFKREWRDYYGEPWQNPVSSPDAQYRASKLKYYLYRRTLQQIFDFVKEYEKEIGKDIKCYVPTHSMINYAHWGIVSPQSSLLEVGCDGYIAQVWTGTSRTPNYYQGVKKERTFETAFLEYGSMQNIARASGKRIWYLNDPIEDNPNHSWYDYRTNWESTLVASLLQPEVWHYEIMPWPHRIYQRDLPATQPVTDKTPRIRIPAEYETQLQAVFTAMGDMKQPPEKVKWIASGTPGMGVLVSDTMMFQRYGPDRSDGDLGSFYGLALPFLMRGMPIEPIQMELGKLDSYKVLLLTYEGMKPPKAEYHDAIAKWVNDGGALIVVDDDKDPFHSVREWWNQGETKYATPRHHLFEKLGLSPDAVGTHRVGKGAVVYESASPARLTRDRNGANRVRALARSAMDITGVEWKESNSLVLQRGPYIIAGGLDDPAADAPAVVLRGRFIPLFDAKQPIISEYSVVPGSRALLVDLDEMPEVGVVSAACRVRNLQQDANSIRFDADGQGETKAVVCMKLPAAPKSVTVNGQALAKDAHEYEQGVLRIRFDNDPEPRKIAVTW